MELKFAPLVSGSSGNALYVGLNRTRLLVDAGVSGTRVTQELLRAGVDVKTLGGILVTHEHSDHIAGVGILSRRYNLPIYATEGTWDAMQTKLGRVEHGNIRVIVPGQDFYLGDLNIMPFEIPHDAQQPVGYTFSGGGVKASVATDIGCVKENWLSCVEGSDVLLLEANHDLDMLKAGRYPYELKRRIMGKKGHLSNIDAGSAAVELVRRGVKRIILGHLSHENNFPELAYRTVADALIEADLPPEAACPLDIAERHSISGVYTLCSSFSEGAQYAGF